MHVIGVSISKMAEGTEDTTIAREEFVSAALIEFESPLIGYATTFVHDVERARDVVQETLFDSTSRILIRLKVD